jgi:large repetitive protein
MKKITLFLLLLYSCCNYAQLAEESFEGTWTTGSGPAGWMILQNGVGLSVTWAQSPTGNTLLPPKSGLRAAYLNSQNVAAGTPAEDYLVTAEFTVPAQNAELIFWSRMTTLLDQGSIYKVLIANITDGADPSDIADYDELLGQPWTELELNPDQTDYNKIVVPIPAAYAGKNVRIAFMMAGDDQDRWLIDDVMVQEHCFEPTDLTINGFGLTSADLNWTPPAETPDGWEIEVMLDYETPDGSGEQYSGPLPYTAEGLTANTDYKYFVRSRCGTDGTSEWIGPFFFTTAAPGETCQAALPVDALPFNDSGNTGAYADFYEGDPCGSTGGASGYLEGNNVIYAYTAAVSGNISITVSGFTGINPYSGVFIYTSCDDIGNMCNASAINDFSAAPLVINPFAVIAGNTYYIVIATPNWYGESTPYNLVIQEEYCMPPTGITVGAATETSVPLTWTEQATAIAWEYAVTMPGAGFPVGAGTATTTAAHTETGMQAGDLRDFYVRSDCGDGTFSSWAGPFPFSTLCGTLDLPFSEGFNSTSDTKHCWKIVDSNGDSFTDGTLDYNKWFLDYYDTPFEGDLDALFYTESPTTDDWLISPTINLTGNQRLRFRYKTSTTLQPGDIQMYLSTTGNEVGDLTIEFGPEIVTAPSPDYTEVLANIVDGSNTPYSGPVNIAWRVNPQALPDGYMFLQFDSIIIEEIPPCADPLLETLEVLSVSTTTAELSWTPGYNETQWYVIIQTDGPDGPVTTSELATSLPHTVTGLEPATEYEYFVRSECGSQGEGNMIGPIAFTTACGTYNVPFYEGFNSDSPTELCWTVLNVDGSEQWYSWYLDSPYLNYVFEGDQAAPHNNDPNAPDMDINDWLISPVINLTGDPAQRLKFHGPLGTPTYELLLSTTGDDPADFTTTLTAVPTGVNGSPTHIEYIVELVDGSNNPISGPVNIAWHVGPGNYNNDVYTYIDNVIIDTCFQPTGLSAGDTTESTAELSWDAGYTETSWQVVIQPIDTGIPTGDGETVNSNAIVADELVSATHYEYYVRADCGSGDTSAWSGPYYFDTKVCDPATQCSYIFTMSNTMDNGQGWYGHTMSVKQNGFTVATLTGPTLYALYPDENYINVQNVEVPLCPGIPFELFWDDVSVEYPFGLAVSVYTPYMEHVYTKNAGGTNTGDPVPGDLLYTGVVTCDPAACAKPMNLTTANITPTSATLEWDEMGSATSWEIWALPMDNPIIPIPLLDYQYYGYPVPVLPLPPGSGASTEDFMWENPQLNYQYFGGPVPVEAYGLPGIVVTEHPYTVTGLTPGIHYAFYVKAICGNGEESSLSGAKAFTTAIINDACDNAITVPVNSGWECEETTHGTVNGSTSEIQYPFSTTYDVWYKFVAENDIHTVSLINCFGDYVSFEVYTGDNCGNLTPMVTMGGPSKNLQGLTIGATYWVRVYTSLSSPPIMNGFDLCVCTPGRPIVVSDEYTMQELVEDFLIGDDCIGAVTNVTSVMGNDFGANPLSIGYFNAEESYFPLREGIVLTTGGLYEVGAYWGNAAGSFQDQTWPGDTELTTILTDALGVNPPYFNASVLEFDFAPTTDAIDLDFVFSSDEYHAGRQCDYADGMAIIITGPDGIPHNIGVVPGTDTPVSVVTIREQSAYYYTGACLPVNEGFFGSYNGPEATGPYYQESEPVSGISHYGQTVAMNAHHDVVAGQQYHVKFVIANHLMARDNSALFIGGFKLEETDLGPDLIVANNTALCEGDEITLESHLDPEKYTFEWKNGDDVIADEDEPNLVVDSAGDYSVIATLTGVGVDCIVTDNRVIEYYAPIEADPIDLQLCGTTGIAAFDLTENTTIILAALNTTDYAVTYHLTTEQAEAEEAPLDVAYTNTTPFLQPVFVRVENTVTSCHIVRSFNLVVTPTPEFTLPATLALCSGTIGTLTIVPGNFNIADAAYAWANADGPLPDTTSGISVTQAGIYMVTVTKNGCSAQASVTVTVIPTPVADVVANVASCQGYTLPALSAGNGYYTATGGQGTAISAGEVISVTQTIFIFAQSGTVPNCTAESSFIVAITPSVTPVTGFTLPSVVCRNATNPVPVPAAGFTTGGVYSANAGATIDAATGAIDLAATANGTYDITYTIAADTANCIIAGATTVTITITDSVTPVTGFDYEEAYCFGTTAITPQLAAGFTPGGAFASSAGLAIDPATGVINAATSTPGTYTVTYTIVPDSANCNPGGTASETVILLEELSFTMEGICDGNNYFIRLVEKSGNFDAAAFEWVNSDGQAVGTDSPELNVTDYVNGTPENEEFPLDFMLTVTDNGCESSEVFSVDGISCFIQRGISPNNDGQNDTFDLSGLDVRKLAIFNRYGIEVYTRNNYINEWNGSGNNGDELPAGTYFYMIGLGNGGARTGWIYINREE